jgi:phenylpropionate dioxygenase-like ring-hydroxylating dioxygenase large terminal subunit
MFVRNAWYVAAWTEEISNKPLGRRICNEPLVLYRDVAGQAVALVDMCCHRGAPLHLGRVVDQGIECGYHGLIFGADGACVHIPGQDRIPERARVRNVPVVEQDGVVWIWPGEIEKADPASIVRCLWHTDTVSWPHKQTMYSIKAAAQLMVDNLMDLTHLGYVHASTIGGNPATHVDAKMEITPTARGVKFTRWMFNSIPPPAYVRAVGFTGRIDRVQMFEFVAPGIVLQAAAADDAGTLTQGVPDKTKRDTRLFHALTPETETTCHYFWCTANGFRTDDPATTAQQFDEIAVAFLEDKTVVEAQQARLTELGEGGLIDIRTDAARLQVRRTMERLLMEETAVQH